MFYQVLGRPYFVLSTTEFTIPFSFCLADRWMKESRNPHTSTRHDQIGRRKRRRKRGLLCLSSSASPFPPLLLFRLCRSNRSIISIITFKFSCLLVYYCSRFQLVFWNFRLHTSNFFNFFAFIKMLRRPSCSPSWGRRSSSQVL